jgi:RNA-directed DNA polymerase
VRKYKGKLLIKPAKASVQSLLGRIREIIKSDASAQQAVVIHKLNPLIRGWATYHHHVTAKACFSSVDAQIWHLLWKWARRRHPTKGARWVRKRYFHADGSRSWIFSTVERVGSSAYPPQLFRAMTVPIKRHVKIRAPANPFAPAWESYFIQRRAAKRSVEKFGAISM